MAKNLYSFLNDQSYSNLWVAAVETLKLPNTQVNSISNKSYLATFVLEAIGNDPVKERIVRESIKASKSAAKNFRRERKLLFPRGR